MNASNDIISLYTAKTIFILHMCETSHWDRIAVFKSKDPESFSLKKSMGYK